MNTRWWKVVGLAGLAGVTATGVVIARDQRRRQAYTPQQVRDRLHDRAAQAADRSLPQAGSMLPQARSMLPQAADVVHLSTRRAQSSAGASAGPDLGPGAVLARIRELIGRLRRRR